MTLHINQILFELQNPGPCRGLTSFSFCYSLPETYNDSSPLPILRLRCPSLALSHAYP